MLRPDATTSSTKCPCFNDATTAGKNGSGGRANMNAAAGLGCVGGHGGR